MFWKLILKYSGTNIHHISGFDNTIADKICKIPSVTNDQDKSSTIRAYFFANDLFITSVDQIHDCVSPLDIFLMQRETINVNSKLNTCMHYQRYV